MEQFIPQVSDSDVERIIKRDLPMEEQEGIRVIMGQLEVREKPRVVLACLKNSGGDIRKLKNNLAEAPGYYREFIAEAADLQKVEVVTTSEGPFAPDVFWVLHGTEGG